MEATGENTGETTRRKRCNYKRGTLIIYQCTTPPPHHHLYIYAAWGGGGGGVYSNHLPSEAGSAQDRRTDSTCAVLYGGSVFFGVVVYLYFRPDSKKLRLRDIRKIAITNRLDNYARSDTSSATRCGVMVQYGVTDPAHTPFVTR